MDAQLQLRRQARPRDDGDGTHSWRSALRAKAGDATYSGSFIARWLRTLLYYDAPAWVFVVCYTLFGLFVVGSWFWVRPRGFGN